MTTFAPHRDAVEFFVDCMHGGSDKDALSGILAEDVVLYGPLGDEPLIGREAVLEAMRTVGTVAADLTYKEVLSGETHHAAYFRLQIEDTVVDGMDYIRLDADGKIAEDEFRLARNVLLWVEDGITYRLETGAGRARALELAASLR